MTQEEKNLLLKDLCARLPYGVICKGIHHDIDVSKDEYVDFEVSGHLTNIGYNYATLGIMHKCELSTIKPYLRLMSSMTEEEEIAYLNLEGAANIVDWLNKKKFDYRGLIPMGLGIDCTGLNIYENEKSI